MFKRKKLIFLSVALLISFVIMGFGVYAASNTNFSMTGQVIYTPRDVSVTVQGKINGAKDVGENDYPTSSSDITTNDSGQITSYKYYSATKGTGFSDNTDNLAVWNFGGLQFAESTSGVADIEISFKITNHSKYPIEVMIDFEKNAEELEIQNITRTVSKTKATIKEKNGTDEIDVVLQIKNDSQSITLANIGMEITMSNISANPEKTVTYDANGLYFTNENDISDNSATTYQEKGETFLEPTHLHHKDPDILTSYRPVEAWYTNPECTGEPVVFPYKPITNVTLYAKWLNNIITYEIPFGAKNIDIFINNYRILKIYDLNDTAMMNLSNLKAENITKAPENIGNYITTYNSLYYRSSIFSGAYLIAGRVVDKNGNVVELDINSMFTENDIFADAEKLKNMTSLYDNMVLASSMTKVNGYFKMEFIQSIYNLYHEEINVPNVTIKINGQQFEGTESYIYWD